MRDTELENAVLDAMSRTPVGEKVEVAFTGKATPVRVKMEFTGGWAVEYTLIPGLPLEFVRGENGYLKAMSVTLLPHDGLKEQV